jgi:WD40 repeat protein
MRKRTLATWHLLAALLVGSTFAWADDPPKEAEPIIVDDVPPDLRGITPRLWAAVFSPDGTKLATTSGWRASPDLGQRDNIVEPGELVVWDVAQRREVLIVRQGATIRTAAFSPNGKLMALGDFDGKVRLIETATGKTKWTVEAHKHLVNSVAFADDDTVISGAFDGEIHFRKVETAKLTQLLDTEGDRVVTIALPDDRKTLAAVTWFRRAFVWDVKSGEKRHAIDAHLAIVEGLAFAPDGKSFLTTGWDGAVKLWETETGVQLATLEGHQGQVPNAAWSPDGKTIATSDIRGKVILWDAQGAKLAEIAAHSGRCGLAFSPDSKLLATVGQQEKTTKLWNVKTQALEANLERRKAEEP